MVGGYTYPVLTAGVAADWGYAGVSHPPPILAGKDFAAPSVFEPENLLREARRQKNLPGSGVPEVCLLEPHGDIVVALATTGRSRRPPSWTAVSPFRGAAASSERGRGRKILAVEMEAAGLYAFARARRKPVLCFAHVTNQMAVIEGDFEKGEADGSSASLAVVATAARAWRRLASRRGSSVQPAQNV